MEIKITPDTPVFGGFLALKGELFPGCLPLPVSIQPLTNVVIYFQTTKSLENQGFKSGTGGI